MCPSVDPDRWRQEFKALGARIDGRFARVESRRRARSFLRGLMAGLPRVNCWALAEHAGDASPGGMQHFLAAAVWDDDGLRADLRDYVVEQLGDPDAVLVIDETGDLKKGTMTVGVQRQYTGTAGRIENAQVAVYLTYAAPAGHAFLDNALYLPVSWTSDPQRCAAAGVPDSVTFATKPTLARQMIAKALDVGVPARWVTGDEVYGNDPALRATLARRGLGYVLAVARSHQIDTKAGRRRAIDLAVTLPTHAWTRISAGQGAKGQRLYDWAFIATSDQDLPGSHHLLIRRNIHTGEYAFYRTHSPSPVPLATYVQVAGIRWTVEDDFQNSKELAALDEHQVRRWTSWHRWTLLAMLAYAFLAVTTARAHDTQSADELIPLTVNEVRHLFVCLAFPRPEPAAGFVLAWSWWRRRHQARAQASHYQRQAAALQLN
ncbi:MULTISPECIES: IS701 family transposase [Parafrankia]|uniref:IS701 family transposase n=1 Tax=Parafrankia sp. CH37 TaxID=683308 RepID=UPI000B84E9BC|nr:MULTISPECIES: IS701 family transposase [Parafrankia]MBE3200377.1 IS701 family transposase [Parafrankia sp. CH37]